MEKVRVVGPAEHAGSAVGGLLLLLPPLFYPLVGTAWVGMKMDEAGWHGLYILLVCVGGLGALGYLVYQAFRRLPVMVLSVITSIYFAFCYGMAARFGLEADTTWQIGTAIITGALGFWFGRVGAAGARE